MEKALYILISSFFIFSGCSDSYDSALGDSYTPPDEKISIDIETMLSDIKKDTDNLTLDEAEKILDDKIAEIENSNISKEEKDEALIEISIIEKEKLDEGLESLTESIQKDEENIADIKDNCGDPVDNSGALPPAFPSDNCVQ